MSAQPHKPTPANDDYDDDDPSVEIPHLRAIKIAVAVMTGFLFLSAFALLMVIFFRLSDGEEAAEPAPFSEDAPAVIEGAETDGAPVYEPLSENPWWEGSRFVSKLSIPEGATILQMTIAGDRLAMVLEADGAREIVLFDLIELRELGVIQLIEGELPVPPLEDE